VTVSTHARAQVVSPLPIAERVAGAPPLTVTLRLGTSRVATGQVPTFTVDVRNSGRGPLLLSPAAVSNIRIFTLSDVPVPPASGEIADYVGRVLTRADFIPLGPGQTQVFAVRPDYHELQDYSRFNSYLEDSRGSAQRVALPAGDYLVRLTYLAFPDYAASYYDPYEITDVWEGALEAAAVPLTVLPPREDEVREAIARIDADNRPLASIDVVRLGRVAAAIDPLLRLFARVRDMRTQIADALVAIDAPVVPPRGSLRHLPHSPSKSARRSWRRGRSPTRLASRPIAPPSR